MPKVTVKGPDNTESVVHLKPAQAVVLGRDPDPATVPRGPGCPAGPFEPVTLAAPSVSANHVLIWADDGGVRLRDLGSKNGTWLEVPSDRPLCLDERDLVLRLAQGDDESSIHNEPLSPAWSGPADFARSVGEALERWLEDFGVEAHVSVGSGRAGTEAPPTRIPLSSGEALDITPLSTAHANWSRLLERVWRWVSKQNAVFDAEQAARNEGIILASRPMRRAHREVIDAAKGGARTLLITGPSGSGKEVLAEVFHRSSSCSGPFVAVNCSMFSKDLLRTELFGAMPGAFTDGKHRILGAVERAQGGTLFLDEIGEMSLDVQPMLLRFLDRREFQSLGQYGRTQLADVNVVTATNRDLREAVRAGAFRADLWYRISIHVVDVPPLRTRWEDVTAFLESKKLEGGRLTLREALTPDALEVLRAHEWQGNFRELSNFVERVVKLPSSASLDAEACREALARGALTVPKTGPHPVVPAVTDADWSGLAARAVQAFIEDRGEPPSTWDDQKDWNEKYLKPLIFFHLSGAGQMPAPMDESSLASLATRVATRMQADRGTAAKQLARYFERFRSA
jgi:DNA-binding NtrC family response regulator